MALKGTISFLFGLMLFSGISIVDGGTTALADSRGDIVPITFFCTTEDDITDIVTKEVDPAFTKEDLLVYVNAKVANNRCVVLNGPFQSVLVDKIMEYVGEDDEYTEMWRVVVLPVGAILYTLVITTPDSEI